MAPLDQAEEDAISARILHQLSKTQYACSSLTQLTGGSANFVYRCILAQALPNGSSSVIIKHSANFVAINRDFPLDVTRGNVEESMLDALANYQPLLNNGSSKSNNVIIRTPRLYMFNQETNTQVVEDFPDTDDLKSVFFSSDVDRLLPGSSAVAIGRHLGSWLRDFHTWASAPQQAAMRASVGQNRPMRDLKRMVTYDGVIPVLENYPELLEGGYRESLEEVCRVMGSEFDKDPRSQGEAGDEWGIIHGDYWSGNVLLSKHPWIEDPRAGEPNKLFIIDWEFSQYGHRAYDLGQMIGDLWERNIFRDKDIVMPVLQGVIESYGEVSEDMAFRVTMHAGTQLVGWYNRRPRTGALVAPREVIMNGLTIGRDLILKGWEKDRGFFERSVLAGLFT